MTLIVSVAAVRDYLKLETNNPTGSSQYTDATISSNILAAQNNLEQATGRWFVDRPSVTWSKTTMFAPVIPLPGFRTLTTVTWNGAVQVSSGASQTVWPLPDNQQTGLYTALQFRAYRPARGGPHYLSDPLYWDKGLDVGLASAWAWSDTSQPLDLVIVGDGGYAPNTEPYALRHAVKVWASFYTMRPNSLLADVAITPQGGVVNYSQVPNEVADFIKSFRGGVQMVSV